MKRLLYIQIVFLFFIACNSDSKAVKEPGNSIRINYIGEIDKPLPTLFFFNSYGVETYDLDYSDYHLIHDAYAVLNKEITKLKTTKEDLALLSVKVNNKQNYYLDKSSSLSFISKVMSAASYKNHKRLKLQLDLYLNVLKSTG